LNQPPTQAQLENNIRRFVLFRLLYSARFYYPVFTVLFLDYGLTLEQFSILNLVWALSIVIAEVPSGALADLIGRKKLIVYAAGLMVVELALIAFVPMGASALLFWMFFGNRVCSGLSEAAASGADEALAFDSLKLLGREDEWSRILERTGHVVSIGFFITMIIGAFAYDPAMVNGMLAAINPTWELSAETIIRLPVILTLITAIIVFFNTLGMKDIETTKHQEGGVDTLIAANGMDAVLSSFRQILRAARWTVNHRFVLFVILAALALDSVARQFVVLASEYYRIIGIPVSWFGFIGAGMALFGIVSARVSRMLVERQTPLQNFLLLSGILLVGLFGIALVVPVVGVFFAIGAFAMMGMVQFQASYYLNREADSSMRATILSFKGLALNLGLGIASLFYTVLAASLREVQQSGAISEELLEDEVYADALWAFPFYYLVLCVALVIAARSLVGDYSVFMRLRARRKD